MSRLPRIAREAIALALILAAYAAELMLLGPHME